MKELSFSDFEPRIKEIESSWAFQLVNMQSVRDRGIASSGTRIAVIDPNPHPFRRESNLFGMKSSDKLEIHGYGIAALIKYMLPEATVSLRGVRNASDVLQEIQVAGQSGADIIHLSMGTPHIPAVSNVRAEFSKAYDALMKRSGSVSEHIRKHDAHIQDRSQAIISRNLLGRTIQQLSENGVVFVASTGYGYTDPKDTFAIYPQVIVSAGVRQNFIPFDMPQAGRVDIYAPGGNIPYPAGDRLVQYSSTHSFAAPFITVAASLARDRLGNNPSKIRELIQKTATEHNGLKVVNYSGLISSA